MRVVALKEKPSSEGSCAAAAQHRRPPHTRGIIVDRRQRGTFQPASPTWVVPSWSRLRSRPRGGEPVLGDPLSGELFRIAVEIRSDEDGIDIKLPGSIRADPSTGRLTTVFDDLPQ